MKVESIQALRAAYDIEAQCILEMKDYFDAVAFARAVHLLAQAPRRAAALSLAGPPVRVRILFLTKKQRTSVLCVILALLLNEILNDRGRELLGEFQRKFDMVRWGIWYERTAALSD